MSQPIVAFGEYGMFEITTPDLLDIVPGGDPTVNAGCAAGSNDICANVNPVCGSNIGTANVGCGQTLPHVVPNAFCIPSPPKPQDLIPDVQCGPWPL